jgi:hypothetical protein
MTKGDTGQPMSEWAESLRKANEGLTRNQIIARTMDQLGVSYQTAAKYYDDANADNVPQAVVDALAAYMDGQSDAAKVARHLPDDGKGEAPAPMPGTRNPMLHFIVSQARRKIEAGESNDLVMIWLATHAWKEGGLEAM